MVATVGKGIDPGYYLRCTEYYLGAGEPPGTWLVVPPELGARAGQSVEAAVFTRIHAGLGPNGRQLAKGGAGGRVANFDLTCSAPKSVSIAYALGTDVERAAIAMAQHRAVTAVAELLGREAAFIRRGRGGRVLLRAQLSIAAFQHAEARPAPHADGRVFADMDLHTHLCIANLGRAVLTEASGAERIVHGAIDGRAIFSAKMACGALYHATLATGLQELGYAVAVTGRNGIFELVGPTGPAVPDATKQYFSARRRQVEERLAEYALASAEAPALAAAVTRGSRADKIEPGADRFAQWRSLADEQGLASEGFTRDLRFSTVPSPAEREAMIRERLAPLPRQLTETQSVFEHRHLVAAVASALVGTGADADRIAAEVHRLAAGDQLRVLGQDRYGHGLYSTPELVAIERNLLKLGRTLRDRTWTDVPRSWLDRACAAAGLSAEQRSAAQAATDGTALAVIEGLAGTGKTTALKLITAAYAEQGKHVLATATAWRTAHMLRDELGVEARALDSLLARVRAGQVALDAGTVVLVDEAGQIGSRAMHALLELAEAGGAKVVLVGDRGQLRAIAAGPALDILARVAEPARLTTIVRQRDRQAREAVTALSQGRVGEALQIFAERGEIAGHVGAKASLTAAVDTWLAARASAPDASHLLIAKSNTVVRALNAEIRRRQRAQGLLNGPEHVVAAADASGRAYRLALARGDRIRFGIRNDTIGAGVINGTTAVVTAVTAEPDGHLLLQVRIGTAGACFSTRALADATGRVRLGHDLAITAYASQGLTAESATVVLDASYDRHDTYVALSRARGTTRIVLDIGLLDAQLNAAGALTEPTRRIEEAERLAHLAARLSRQTTKSSTLDLAPAADEPVRARVRTATLEL